MTNRSCLAQRHSRTGYPRIHHTCGHHYRPDPLTSV